MSQTHVCEGREKEIEYVIKAHGRALQFRHVRQLRYAESAREYDLETHSHEYSMPL